MKKFFLIPTVLLLLISSGFSQEISSINLLDNISSKPEVTLKEALTVYKLVTNKDYNKLDIDLNQSLRRGTLAKIIADELDLSNSLLYKIIKIERYAYYECVYAGIMKSGQSTYDIISGSELLDAMNYLSGKNNE